MAARKFGGTWSDLKLRALGSYLPSYTSALSKSSHERVYIDAFAGAGMRAIVDLEDDDELEPEEKMLFPEDEETDFGQMMLIPEERSDTTKEFRHGSPLIALETNPEFHRFVFIDKDVESLNALREQVEANFPKKLFRVQFMEGDANERLEEITNWNWNTRRAVVFLDPFALHVKWSTIQRIAKTRSMDMWLLFPAMAVNRMMPRSGVIPPDWASKLTEVFGSADWESVFFEKSPRDMFGEEQIRKNSTAFFERLSKFVTSRLEDEFFGVHDEPLILKSSKGIPLFLFCFAAGNPTGAPIALRIANSILKKANGQ